MAKPRKLSAVEAVQYLHEEIHHPGALRLAGLDLEAVYTVAMAAATAYEKGNLKYRRGMSEPERDALAEQGAEVLDDIASGDY